MEVIYGNTKKLLDQDRPRQRQSVGVLRLYAIGALLVLLTVQNLPAAVATGPLSQAFSRHFEAEKDYQPGDLVTRGDFDQIVEYLKSTQVPVDRFGPLREAIPANDAYIQRLNASSHGKRFLREVAKTPGGYRSVEELASRPRGEKTVNQLSRDKGGQRMIGYLATAPGGKKMMKQIPGGKHRKAPVPRIYTAEQLLAAMQAKAGQR